MARITVEDCLDRIPNRFQLVLAATYRAAGVTSLLTLNSEDFAVFGEFACVPLASTA